MMERTLELIVEQLCVFLQGLPQNTTQLARWGVKMLKSYKALRIMEAHKTAEPKFARSMMILYP